MSGARDFSLAWAARVCRKKTELTGDIADALSDLASISQVANLEDEEGDEEDEVSYSELVEYVRVAVLLVYAELNPVDDHRSPTIH